MNSLERNAEKFGLDVPSKVKPEDYDGVSREDLIADLIRYRGYAEEPRLMEMAWEVGGKLRMALEPNIGVRALAASFADTLGKAPNFMVITLGPWETPKQGQFEVTIQRLSKETPAQQMLDYKSLLRKILEYSMQNPGSKAADNPDLGDRDREMIARALMKEGQVGETPVASS